jgi:PhnB protein
MAEIALERQLDQAIGAMLAGSAPVEQGTPEFAGLVELARALQDLPDDRFKMRLGAELLAKSQGRTPMTTHVTSQAKAVIQTVTPFITVPDGANLIGFMKHVFDAEDMGRHPHGSGDGFVATVRIGSSDLLVMAGESLRGHERPATLHVYMPDCDAAYLRALDAGASPILAPADYPYGERAGFVADPFGNRWNIATRLGSSYVPEGRGRVGSCLDVASFSAVMDFLGRAFGAEEEGPRRSEAGRVTHAFVRMGKDIVEMGEWDEHGQPRPFAFYLHTDDVDAVYHRAVAAGAVSLSPPADQAYGDRMAVLLDPFGNQWIPAMGIKSST